MQVQYFSVGSLIWKRVAVDKKSIILPMPYQKQHSARLRTVMGASHARSNHNCSGMHLILAPIAIKTETRRLEMEY